MLLPLVTSLLALLPTFSNPGSTSQSLRFEDGAAMRVELAFADGSGGVPLPIRLHGIDSDRDVVVCDTSACLQPRIIRVAAHTVVDVDAPTNESGVPILGVFIDRFFDERCCDRTTNSIIAAVVTDAIAATTRPSEYRGELVSITPVGRLFDEHPALMSTVPVIALVDGDLNHDEAFFGALRQFVVDGGALSVDASQAARLGTVPTTARLALDVPECTIADASRTTVVSSTHAIAGAVHVLDGAGIVVVRPAQQSMRDAVADLAFAAGSIRFGSTMKTAWLSDDKIVRAVLSGLQPPVGTSASVAWFLLFGAVAGASALIAWRRQQPTSPVHAALLVFAVASSSVVVAATIATVTATTRRTEVVVHGPGSQSHSRTTMKAAVNDVDTPTSSIAFVDAPTAFMVASHSRTSRLRTGANVAAVGIWHTVEHSAGWLEQRWDGSRHDLMNHFSHEVTVISGPSSRTIPANATVSWPSDEAWGFPSRTQTTNIAENLAARFGTAIAIYVDDTGVSHFVVGTPR